MGFLQRRVLKAVIWVVTWPKITLAVSAVLLASALLLAWGRLHISTDQNKLFSEKVPVFHHYLDFTRAFPENEAIYIVIEAKDPQYLPPLAQWTNLADAIVERLNHMPAYVRLAQAGIPVDQLGPQGLLFAPRADVSKTLMEFTGLAAIWGQEPNLITRQIFPGRTPLERFLRATAKAPDPRAALFAGRLADTLTYTLDHLDQPFDPADAVPGLEVLGAVTPRDLGYNFVPDESDPTGQRHLLLVQVFHQERYDSLTAISETVEAIRRAARETAADNSNFTVGVSGRPALEADEMRTTDHDTQLAEILAASAVFLGLVVMLRSVWLALVAELSLGVGIGWTLGWATLSVGELNLLSIVFVIALIGIGMDYLIQILTRYRREARRYVRQTAIWSRVFRYVSPPISTACFGAAGAFFVSLLTDFRGAAELGLIAGAGLLLCLLAGYTVLPALLVLWPPKLKPVPRRYSDHHPPPPAGWWKFIGPITWIALILAGIYFGLQTRFNPNLLELQAPGLESVQLVHKLPTWYAVVLSDDLATLRKVRAAVDGAPTVKNTESLLDAQDNLAWLQEHPQPAIAWADPPERTPDDLPALATAARDLAVAFETLPPSKTADIPAMVQDLRHFAARLTEIPADQKADAAARLSLWQRAFVAQIKDAYTHMVPAELNLAQLPPSLRNHLLSTNPQTHAATYALYIYPKANLWDRANLAAFEQEVEARVATIPHAPSVTGISSNIYHTTAAIHRAFFHATCYALALIVLLVFLDLRRLSHTLIAISVLALGLPMLLILMGLPVLWGGRAVDWNFANFFALPILIGAGHEYGVFMVHRYREVLHNPRRVWRFWDVSDRALLLCAYVTCASFGFFWLFAQHRGLASLGWVMAVGIACIYVATIAVVRPLLTWRLNHRRVYDEPSNGED